jgi:hypothetical protein
LSIDPSDDCTFWFTGEYVAGVGSPSGSTPNWRTRIGSFRFPTCGTPTVPSLSVADASVSEGNVGNTTVAIPITLSAPAATDVTVNFSTRDGTAIGGSDYASTTGSVTVPSGATAATAQITIHGDTTPEANESFIVDFSGAVGATLVDSDAVATIIDDDIAPVSPTIRIDNRAIKEGNDGTRVAAIRVRLSAPSASPVRFSFATNAISATAGSDYQAIRAVRTFAPGQTALTVAVVIVGDRTVEANETFAVDLSRPQGATFARRRAVVTVVNDD